MDRLEARLSNIGVVTYYVMIGASTLVIMAKNAPLVIVWAVLLLCCFFAWMSFE